MKARVLRFTGSWKFVAITVMPCMALMTYIALTDGEATAIASLSFFAFTWCVFALVTGRWLDESYERSIRAYKGWSEQEDLTLDLTHLLGESLEHLSTWDREKADEIADRTNTVIRLRFQNFKERNHP